MADGPSKRALVLSDAELARVREQLRRYPWYRSILERFRVRVDELVARRPPIPVAKGRAFYESCPRDHAQLTFDPYAPHDHVCPKCGTAWTGETFDLAWVRQFQGWHAKRLVEAGILYRLEADERYARIVRDAFRHFVERYRDYPLANNLLGPTRLFQSTFLEAFWLVDMVAAHDLTSSSPSYSADDHEGIRRLLYESAGIVKGFDEGISNRQAFNNAGMGAVALLYDDEALLWHVLAGPHGFSFHMRESLLEDGIWYEGETYHFATLDHSLNLAEMARHRGIDLYEASSEHGSLEPMFYGPLKVLLPDLTFPSRKDSWFGRGVGYHREVYELGYARYGDTRFGGLLAHAYERGQDRTDVGWRTFLYLDPDLPDVELDDGAGRMKGSGGLRVADLRTTTVEEMPGTGMAVLRRDDGATYVGLEYGHYGGGHGHPDRLHLTLFADGQHWLVDPGTGWYHVPELGWYRSTLAHNTVTVDAASQTPTEGSLTAFGSAGGLQTVQAVVSGAYPDVSLRRTLCLGDGFLLDAVDVQAGEERTVDWAFHVRGELAQPGASTPIPEPLAARGGHPFLTKHRRIETGGVDATARADGSYVRIQQSGVQELFVAEALGVPLHENAPFRTMISRRRGRRVRYATAWLWGRRLPDVEPVRPEAPEAPAVAFGGEGWRMVLDDAPGVGVVETLEGQVRSLAWFGKRHLAAAGVQVECDRELPSAAVQWRGSTLVADLPQDFGRVRLRGQGVPATAEVVGLPEGAVWSREGEELLLQQRPGLEAWLLRAGRRAAVPAGRDGVVRLGLGRYGSSSATATAVGRAPDGVGGAGGAVEAPSLDLPPNWRLHDVQLVETNGPCSTWDVRVRAPADAAAAEIGVLSGGDRATLPVEAEPPLELAWTVWSDAGVPEVRLVLRDVSGLGGRVRGEVSAPWLCAAPHVFALELDSNGTATTRLTLPSNPVPPVPAGPPARGAASGDGRDSVYPNAGEFALDARVHMDRFVATSRLQLPLNWCLRHRSASGPDAQEPAAETPAARHWGRMRLDRSEQAYWAERPWGGLQDASASARLTWDDGGLHFVCLVLDDRHVSDANQEDAYENDSLQLYLDFRPPDRQDASFAPGVAAYVFAPGADLATVRIEAIAGSRELANRGLTAPWFTTRDVVARVAPMSGGYRLSAVMPYGSLGIERLQPGQVFRADLSLSDNDGGWYRKTQLVWSGARGDRRCYLRWAYLDPAEYGYVVVGEQ